MLILFLTCKTRNRNKTLSLLISIPIESRLSQTIDLLSLLVVIFYLLCQIALQLPEQKINRKRMKLEELVNNVTIAVDYSQLLASLKHD